MVFTGSYLRVNTPRTIDGATPLLVDGVLQYKEDFLPLSARQFLEEQNKNLPEILRKKIEVVKPNEAQKEPQTKKIKL